MTEKQMLKLEGKIVRFTFRVHHYDVKSEIVEGYVKPDPTTIYVMRNNVVKPYNHYDFYIVDDKRATLIKWNQLKNITNLEVF